MLGAASAYVLLRVALAARATVIVPHLDAPSYQVAPSFTGAHSRPWVVPALYSLVDGRGATLVQAAIGGLAFLALAIKPSLPQRPASVFGATVTCSFVLTTIGYGGAAWVVGRAVALGAR